MKAAHRCHFDGHSAKNDNQAAPYKWRQPAARAKIAQQLGISRYLGRQLPEQNCTLFRRSIKTASACWWWRWQQRCARAGGRGRFGGTDGRCGAGTGQRRCAALRWQAPAICSISAKSPRKRKNPAPKRALGDNLHNTWPCLRRPWALFHLGWRQFLCR